MSHLVSLEADTCSCAPYDEDLHSKVLDNHAFITGMFIINILILGFSILTLWRVHRIEHNQYVLDAKVQELLDLMASIREAVVRYCAKGVASVAQSRQAVIGL